MSEHAWVLENMPGYIAGGLDIAEAERLRLHVAACAACAGALNRARKVDRTLETLFAGVAPDPALEDRLIRSLRAGRPRRRWRSSLPLWVAGSAAAVVLLGALGAEVSEVTGDSRLPFPGMAGSGDRNRAQAQNNLRQIGLAAINAANRYSGHLAELRSAGELAEQIRATAADAPALADAERLRGDLQQTYREAWQEGKGMSDKPMNPPAAGIAPGASIAPGSFSQGDVGRTSNSMLGLGVASQPKESARPGQLVGGAMAPRGISAPVQEEGEERSPPGSSGQVGTGRASKAAPGVTSPYLNLLRPGKDTTRSYSRSQMEYTYRNDSLAPEAGQPASLSEGRAKTESKTGKGADHFTPSDLVYPELRVVNATPERISGGEKGEQQAQSKPGGNQGKASEQNKPSEPASPDSVTPRKIIIRSGEIEFEIDSFDAAVAAITRLVGPIKNGFVATVNSEKLANGKVRGSVVVRVPPESLDTLVTDLRKELGKAGELKSQRIGSQDISKQYTDLESRLRAARAMEERLLLIIKTGKGEIKDLLQAEKELGTWRTRIEEIEGELRYYANLVALSTLTITLYEKEIRAPSAIAETERIQMGIEVEDVDKARQQALAAVTDAKGRITKAEFKQYPGGQYSALLQFEVSPEAAGPLRDRLKQLGTLARLEIDRLQQAEGGSGPPQDIKVKRNDAQFVVSLYNLANVEPRETVNLNLACLNVEATYQALLARVHKTTGRIVTSNLNRLSKEQTTGTIKFEVRAGEADVVLQGLKEAGEVMRLQITENPDIQNTTTSKRGFNVSLAALDQVEPRDKTDLQVATRDVPAGYRTLVEAVARAKGRMLNAQLNEQDKQNITAQLDFDVRRAEESAVEAALAKMGDVYSRNVVRAPDNENITDSKVRLRVALLNVARIPPGATYTLAVEVGNVDNTAAAVAALVHESQGRTVESHVARRPDGGVVAKQIFDVPLAAAPGLLERFKSTGTVRVEEATRNPQVPETALAVARLDVTLSNEKLIVPSDNGLWPQVRKGLSNSLLVIFWSLSWVIFGLLVVLPWALLIYGIYRLVMRLRKRPGSVTTTA